MEEKESYNVSSIADSDPCKYCAYARLLTKYEPCRSCNKVEGTVPTQFFRAPIPFEEL